MSGYPRWTNGQSHALYPGVLCISNVLSQTFRRWLPANCRQFDVEHLASNGQFSWGNRLPQHHGVHATALSPDAKGSHRCIEDQVADQPNMAEMKMLIWTLIPDQSIDYAKLWSKSIILMSIHPVKILMSISQTYLNSLLKRSVEEPKLIKGAVHWLQSSQINPS